MNTNISNYQEKNLLQFSKNEDFTTKNYFKFRAEVESDVIDFYRNLMEVSDSYFVIWEFGYSRVFCLPDVECKLTTSLSIDQVRNCIKLNIDSHVMIETLNYTDQYDGERYQV